MGGRRRAADVGNGNRPRCRPARSRSGRAPASSAHAKWRREQLPASLHARACAAFGAEGLAELVYLIGGYRLVSLLLNAFAVPVPGRDENAAS